jgi:hypothetical protein
LEVTRDTWKSTFKEALKSSWKGWFYFSPIRCVPPRHLRGVQTRINTDEGARLGGSLMEFNLEMRAQLFQMKSV